MTGDGTDGPPSLARAFEDGPAFVPYLAAGDPTPAATREYVDALVEGGADAVELGLPFSEPIAEGTTIQEAIVRSLEGGMTPDRYFELAARIREDVDVPLVAMTYYNLVYQYGEERGVEPFVRAAADAGIGGVIVPDLPVDESDPLLAACEAHGLDLVFIVAPTTTEDRLDRIMDRVSGYVYVQARLGTTGARTEVSDRTAESLARLEGYDDGVPRAVGFGIRTGEHAERVVAAGADGVIVGSALVDIVADGVAEDRPTGAVADRIERTARELKRGALRGAGIDPDARGPAAGGDRPPEEGTDRPPEDGTDRSADDRRVDTARDAGGANGDPDGANGDDDRPAGGEAPPGPEAT